MADGGTLVGEVGPFAIFCGPSDLLDEEEESLSIILDQVIAREVAILPFVELLEDGFLTRLQLFNSFRFSRLEITAGKILKLFSAMVNS